MYNSRTYGEWTYSSMMRVKKDLLMTLEYLMEHKGRDDGKAFSSSQLDDIEHAVKSIHCIMHIKKDLAEWESSNMKSACMTMNKHTEHTPHVQMHKPNGM